MVWFGLFACVEKIFSLDGYQGPLYIQVTISFHSLSFSNKVSRLITMTSESLFSVTPVPGSSRNDVEKGI